MQRLPLLLHSDQSMMSFLQDYEILGCEPLDDIKNHIENLYSELPRHLNSTERKLIEETIAVSFEQKENKARCRLQKKFGESGHSIRRENK